MKRAYIGYDLGDGETITDFVVMDDSMVAHSSKTVFIGMTMPDNNTPGQAIPTAFGYDEQGKLVFTSSILQDPECVKNVHSNFKRRPTDLFPKVTKERRAEMLTALEKDPRASLPELKTPGLEQFAESVIAFTDAIFTDPKYSEAVRGASLGCGEIVVSVGHPTRWDDLDVAIYASILKRSCLGSGAYVGFKMSLKMEAESRAAYLYIKDSAGASLPKGSCALLIDVGSSTIDLTAMTADSRNHQYNSGSNYLGARSIDFLIRDWYLGRLKADEDDWMSFQTLISMNPTADQALTLGCRRAKEDVYSLAAQKSKIFFADFAPAKLDQALVNDLASTCPIAPILKRYIGIPENEAAAMGSKSWTTLFKEFLGDQKAKITARGLKIGRIILTGSASKMPFVGQIVREIYPELKDQGVINDMNPSRSISMGLALVGTTDVTSGKFQADLKKVMDNDVPRIIAEDIPVFIDSLADVISSNVRKIVIRRVSQWKHGDYATLNDMSEAIKQDCSEENINKLLGSDTEYQEALRHWTVDIVSQDIAKKLQGLCDKYGVKSITLDDLNVLKVPSVKVGGFTFDPMENVLSVISNVISLLAGVITAIIMPVVMGLVVGLISFISLNLAIDLLALLLAIPGAGLTLLIAIAGTAAFAALRHGMKGVRESVARKIQGYNLPGWARKLLTDNRIQDKLDHANIREQVRDSIDTPECREKIIDSVKENLNRQIAKRMEEIKYVIESK